MAGVVRQAEGKEAGDLTQPLSMRHGCRIGIQKSRQPVSRREFKLSGAAKFELGAIQQPNKPLLDTIFCPLQGRKGASAAKSSCSRKLGGL